MPPRSISRKQAELELLTILYRIIWELRCSDLNSGAADGSIRKNNYPAPIVDIAMSVARNEKNSTVKVLNYYEFKKFERDNFNFLLGKSDRGSETIYYFDVKQNYSRCVYFYATTEEKDLSGESAEIVRLGLFSFEEIKAAISKSKYMNERMVALCEEL